MVSDTSVIETVEALRRHSVGAGPLEPLLREPGVTDVLVNGPDQVFVDRGAGLELTGLRFADDVEVRRLAQRLAASVGRRLDDAVPFVDARLADGTRVHAVLGIGRRTRDLHLAPGAGAAAPSRWTDCVASGIAQPRRGRRCCERIVQPRLAFLVCGGTGLGQDHPARRPARAGPAAASGS